MAPLQWFTVCLKVPDLKDRGDYERLHSQMSKVGFEVSIHIADENLRYHIWSDTTETVFRLAKQAVETITENFTISITKG